MRDSAALERVVENILLAPPRSDTEVDYFIDQLDGTGAAVELVEGLRRRLLANKPTDGLADSNELKSLARRTLHRLGNDRYEADFGGDRAILQSGDEPVPRLDLVSSGSPDDPSGYASLRSFLLGLANFFDGNGRPTAARNLREILDLASLATEWMGESALVLRDQLANPLPAAIRFEMERAVAAIRQGFLRVGQGTNF